ISRPPVVALAVDDAMAVPFQKIDDRFHRVPVPERTPILPFFRVRRNHIIPEPMSMVVRTEPSIDHVNMFVLAELFLDVRPLEKNFLAFAPPLLVLGELYAMHH